MYGRERRQRSDHQKHGGAARSHASEKHLKKAYFEDTSQDRGFECSVTILPVRSQESATRRRGAGARSDILSLAAEREYPELGEEPFIWPGKLFDINIVMIL